MSDESLVDDIAWVDVICQKDATDNLKLAYEAVKGKDGTVENLYLANTTQIYPEDRGTNYSVRMAIDIANLINN
mgnify:CR=1 FL=1